MCCAKRANIFSFGKPCVRVCAACVKRPVANGGKREKGRGWQFGGGRRKKQARREEEERRRRGRGRRTTNQNRPRVQTAFLLSVGLNQKVFSPHMRAGNEDLQLFCNPAACRWKECYRSVGVVVEGWRFCFRTFIRVNSPHVTRDSAAFLCIGHGTL